jgi:zinc protease
VDKHAGGLFNRAMPKKSALWLVVLSLAVASAAAVVLLVRKERPEAPTPPPDVLAQKRFRVNDGLEVELVSGNCGDQAAIVTLFDVGVEHDPAGRSGMAYLIRELLSAPTDAGRPAPTVAVGSDYTLSSVLVPRADIERELGVVAERMKTPIVDQAALARARAKVLADAKQRRGGDPILTAMAHAAESASASRAQGYFGGIPSEIESIQLADVEAYLREHYQPGNAQITIAGQFDEKKIQARTLQLFGPLPSGTRPSLRPPSGSSVRGTLVMGNAPKAIAIGAPAPLPKDHTYPAYLVLATRLLDGPFAAQVKYEPLARPEILFVLHTLTAGESPEPTAEKLKSDVVAHLSAPLGPRDIEATKARFAALLGFLSSDPALCKKNPRELAVARARGAELGLDPGAVERAIDELTEEQLGQAREAFAPARTSAVIAGGELQ